MRTKTRDGLLSLRGRLLFRAEIRRSLNHPANVKFLLLLPFAVLLSEWPYVGHPLVPVFLLTFIGLEPQFNNILFRSEHEFESLAVLPTNWHLVVLMKNLATGTIASGVAVAGAAVIGYFSPLAIRSADAADGTLYFLSVVFSILIIGNLHSVQHPRRTVGMTASDLADALLMLPTILVCSIPYAVLSRTSALAFWLLLYILAGLMLWAVWSVPNTARAIRRERERLCQTE